MTLNLKDLGGGFVEFQPDPALKTGAEVLALLTGPVKDFAAKCDAKFAIYEARIAELSARIDKLEQNQRKTRVKRKT
jgi:hypothetical protein